MPILPTITRPAFTRTEGWNKVDSESLRDDVFFQVTGIVLAVATLGVAFIHYRHLRSSGGGGEETPIEASALGMSQYFLIAIPQTGPDTFERKHNVMSRTMAQIMGRHRLRLRNPRL